MPERSRAVVIVLGDLGRSPRMLRHAESLSRIGFDVDLIGFRGAELPSRVADNERIHVRRMRSFDRLRGHTALTFPLTAALRQIALACALTLRLMRIPRPRVVLLQNPPAFPALPIALLFARLRRSRLIVDWHNFTSPMLRLRPASNPLVRVVRRGEIAFARRAAAHLTVSAAMADQMERELGLEPTVVRDRATDAFVFIEDGQSCLSGQARLPVLHRQGATTIVVPTSWGADEDFELLYDALQICDRVGTRMQFLITGDGERRAEYEKRFSSLRLRNIEIRTAWFSADDYPRALASADLGVSLHRSASGVDLAAKVPEMLACGLPVCAFDYGPAVREQIRDGEDGVFFSNAKQLAAAIASFCQTPLLDRLRRSIRATPRPLWDEEWNRSARPLIESAP